MDPVLFANDKLNELLEYHDNFHLVGRTEKEAELKKKSEMIQTILLDYAGDNVGEVCFIRGKAICSSSSLYSPIAEELLARAVKLEPSKEIFWVGLATCLWKKNDKAAAKSCFVESIKVKPSKGAYRELSILSRKMTDESSQEKIIMAMDASIQFAKDAIGLDVRDHMSWYVLGNATCAKYFLASLDVEDLQKSLAAYKRSEQLGGQGNPDLYFNRGNVLLFLQCFAEARASYLRAQDLDPSLTVPANVALTSSSPLNTFVRRVQRLFSSLPISAERGADLVQELRTAPISSGSVGFQSLTEGANLGVLFSAKIIVSLADCSLSGGPANFLCLDSFGGVGVVAVYSIGDKSPQFSEFKTIAVADPALKLMKADLLSLSSERSPSVVGGGGGIAASIPIVQAFSMKSLRIEGAPVVEASFAKARMTSDTFDA